MPFGATNAPATFQRLMADCLGDLNVKWCIVYLDDVIVFSKTPDEHLERLEAVFQKLSAAGLKLKNSKCIFFKNEISVRERFYWDTLYKDSSDYVAQCPRCFGEKVLLGQPYYNHFLPPSH